MRRSVSPSADRGMNWRHYHHQIVVVVVGMIAGLVSRLWLDGGDGDSAASGRYIKMLLSLGRRFVVVVDGAVLLLLPSTVHSVRSQDTGGKLGLGCLVRCLLWLSTLRDCYRGGPGE